MPCGELSFSLALVEVGEPGVEPLLEEIGGIGVVVPAALVEEEVALVVVAIHVRVGCVIEEALELIGVHVFVGIREVNLERHLGPPHSAQRPRRQRAANEKAAAHAPDVLREDLGLHRSQTKPHHNVRRLVVASGASGNFLNRVVADRLRVPQAIVEPAEGDACVAVRRVDRVAVGVEPRGEGTEAISEAVRVMEEQDLCHDSSVTLARPERAVRGASGTKKPRGRAGHEKSDAHKASGGDGIARVAWEHCTSGVGGRRKPKSKLLSPRMLVDVASSQTVARAYVVVQGVLFLVVGITAVLPGPTLFRSVLIGVALVVVGAAGVLWTARVLGRSLTPLPVPNGAGLVAAGPYRAVRHPMYSALVVLCLGVAVGSGALWCYVACLVLGVFFGFKARYEERFLMGVYPGYLEYGARTGRFVPFVGRLKLSTD